MRFAGNRTVSLTHLEVWKSGGPSSGLFAGEAQGQDEQGQMIHRLEDSCKAAQLSWHVQFAAIA